MVLNNATYVNQSALFNLDIFHWTCIHLLTYLLTHLVVYCSIRAHCSLVELVLS